MSVVTAIMLLFLLLFLQTDAMGVPSSKNFANNRHGIGSIEIQNPPRFPNIGYLGGSYNLFKGNPLSTKGLDPGFTFRNPFKFTYNKGATTPDGRYSIPDHTQASQSSACSFQFSSESVQDTYSYRDSLRNEVKTSFGAFGASFSSSTDYKQVHERTGSEGSKYVSSAVKCEAYLAALLSSAELSVAFREDVKHLPTHNSTASRRLVHKFYNRWGTHYAHRMRMGGRYGVRSSFSSSSYAELYSKGLDVKTAAGYSGMRSLNNEVVVGKEREKALKFESQREDYQIYQIGGKPPLDSSGATTEWAKTVKDNPIPLTYDLAETRSLLTSANFPDDEKIDFKRETLLGKDELMHYCMSLEVADIDMCTKEIFPIETIAVTVNQHYKKIQCKPQEEHYAQKIGLDQYILGTLGYFENKGGNASVITAKITNLKNSSLVKQAKIWKLMYVTGSSFGILRPTCPQGFSSISDFICCDPRDANACLLSIPRAAPCIADKCLTQCTLTSSFTEDKDYEKIRYRRIIYGSSSLGNAYYKAGPQFIRAFSKDNYDWINERQWAKCLDFSCLKFVSL